MPEPTRLGVVGAGALGLSRTIARAHEHAYRLAELRSAFGETYMRRVERMYLQSPWDLDKSEWHAQRLAVFEWMATALSTTKDPS